MDVTSEYAKVAQQIKRSTSSLSNIEKLAGLALLSALSQGSVWRFFRLLCSFKQIQTKIADANEHRATDGLVENVDKFNENLAKLDPALNDIDELALAEKGE